MVVGMLSSSMLSFSEQCNSNASTIAIGKVHIHTYIRAFLIRKMHKRWLMCHAHLPMSIPWSGVSPCIVPCVAIDFCISCVSDHMDTWTVFMLDPVPMPAIMPLYTVGVECVRFTCCC